MKALVFAFLFLVTAALPLSRAGDNQSSLTAMIKETQRIDNSKEGLTLVWWIPVDYWKMSLASTKNLSQKQIDEMMKVLSDYTVVMVIEGKKGGKDLLDYEPLETVRKNTVVTLPSGEKLSPLEDKELNPDARSFFAVMRPALANMMGKLGENANFLVFANKDKDGKVLLDPRGTGKLTVQAGTFEASWRLPLGSVLDPKTCPACKESFPGNYSFCPFDGTGLK